MAPTKTAKLFPTLAARPTTRSSLLNDGALKGKRKADDPSLLKEQPAKRSALGDLTNAASKLKAIENKSKTIAKQPIKKVTVQSKVLPSIKTSLKPLKQNENAIPHSKVQTRAQSKPASIPEDTVLKFKEAQKEVQQAKKIKTRLSNKFEKTDESVYSTPPEQFSKNGSSESMSVTLVANQIQEQLTIDQFKVPEGVADIDKENVDDVFQVANYSMDIFNYLKSREPLFTPKDYMSKQTEVNCWMRSLLVDWMVELQESFELNHETLYLGVKLTDLFLSKAIVSRENLQLVGAAAMFLASKYDERMPPLVDDFLYICDGAYTRNQMISMEIKVIKTIGFDLGMPLSYRFLRRYAKCAKLGMATLTLARFILEYSLMDYDTITLSDSKLAAAALYLALQMKRISGWTRTLTFYTGYNLEDFISIVHLLNNGLHRKPKEQLMTVRNKYSHEIFFEVAKIPLLDNADLEP